MSSLNSKPDNDPARIPKNVLRLIMLNLEDSRTIFTGFIHVCKLFREVYFDFLSEIRPNLTNELRSQSPKNFLQGVKRLLGIITYPFEILKTI